MDWGTFGVINNHVESQRVVVMATRKPVDTVWEDIFDSLILEAEPPHRYVKRVTITTKDGQTFSISPQDFSALIEQEKQLPPGLGEIQSAKMSLDFNRIKKDVDKWSQDLLSGFDSDGKASPPKFSKPKVAKKTAKKPTKKASTSTARKKPVKRKRKPSAD
jgi:hypothetical protein